MSIESYTYQNINSYSNNASSICIEDVLENNKSESSISEKKKYIQ